MAPEQLEPGLRERKKRATREALASATMNLAIKHGWENVRVEDIAAEVGISPRTFNNYFSSKQEALTARFLARMNFAARALRERPLDEPVWESITHAITAQWESSGKARRVPPPEILAELRLIISVPALRSEALIAAAAEDNEFAAAIADRLGLDVTKDLYPRLLAATLTTATQVVMEHWLQIDPPTPYLPLLKEALRQLEAGLPDPRSQNAKRETLG